MNLKTLLLAFFACVVVTRAADEWELGPVIAKGKGVEVRRGQFDDAFVAYRANLAARGANIAEPRRDLAEGQLLDRMIVTQLLVGRSTPADREAAKTNAMKFFNEARKNIDSDEAFVRHLKSLGMTLAQFTNRVMEQAISEEVVKREVKPDIKITDAQVKNFYETNGEAFTEPELARASHILIATRDLKSGLPYTPEQKAARKETADKLLERVRKGEDFAKLAMENSDDPGAKENRGEYKFTRAKDDPRRAMVPEFEKKIFGMKAGDISELVTTDYGFHIIKLHEILPAKKTLLTEVQEKIREHLTQLELEKRMPVFFAKVKKEAAVEITDDRLRASVEKAGEELRRQMGN